MTAGQPVSSFLPLEEALQRLVNELERINPLNPDENPNNEDPDFYERARIIAVVMAVTKFMVSIPELAGMKNRPLDKMRVLLSHLSDVNKGLKVRFFSPPRKRGKKKPSTVDRYARAHAAAAMHLFAEAGDCSNEKAARQVARRLGSIGGSRLFTDESERYKQVKSWREEVMGDDAGLHYQNLVAMGKATGQSPEQAGKNILELFPRKSF